MRADDPFEISNAKVDDLLAFIEQSNRIERIARPVTSAELVAHSDLLTCQLITVDDVVDFVARISGGQLRDRKGMNVRVGDDAPLAGGPGVTRQLDLLLHAMNEGALTPWEAHLDYVRLHPFTDGNGRSGRALWAWMTARSGENPFELPFLQRFYYDTIAHAQSRRF